MHDLGKYSFSCSHPAGNFIIFSSYDYYSIFMYNEVDNVMTTL